MLINPDTLRMVQRERYNELVREAELERLLQTLKSDNATAHTTIGTRTTTRLTTNVVATLLQPLVVGVQTRLRAALPR